MTRNEIEEYLKDPENKKEIHANFVAQIDESLLQKFNITREALLNSHTDYYLIPEAPALTTTSTLFPEPEIEEKKRSYKRSGHLIDQTLQYNYPKDKSPQLPIFSELSETTKNKMREKGNGVEITEIAEGIKLTTSEHKVIDCLQKLLHDKSQNLEPNEKTYYTGNSDFSLVNFSGEPTPAPKLAFTLYELTLEYKGREYVGGKDLETVRGILQELDKKRFLLSYVETTKNKDGSRRERKIEGFEKLINILQLSDTTYSKDNIELSKKEDTIIVLNPIFRRQIDTKFILTPADLTRRTIIAYGNHNLSDVVIRLRDYLMREHSAKRYKPQIGLEKLYFLLAEKSMKESRKARVKKFTDEALRTVIAMGLLLSYEIKPDRNGEEKIVFLLDKNWK